MLDFILYRIIFPLYGTVDRKLEFPYHIRKNDNAKYNVFYFHGNAELIGGNNFIFELLHDECNFIEIEYPGYYNRTEPLPPFDSVQFMSEIEDTFNQIYYSDNLPDLPIIFIGCSIGSIVAGALAKRLDTVTIHKMVLITPIAEISSNLFNEGDPRRLFFTIVDSIPEFNNIEMLKQTDFPVLLITVIDDKVVSNHNTNLLMNVRSDVENIYATGDHNNIRFDSSLFKNFIIDD